MHNKFTIRYKCTIRSFFYLYLLILVLYSSCISDEETEFIKIDPRIFPEKKITLTEIAKDIKYIPLDNSFPIGHIYSYKFVCGYIYMAIKNIGVVRFTLEGKFDTKYGSIGNGPGEYIYFMKFAVYEDNGTVYIMDNNMDDIEVYNSKGGHIRNIKLPGDDYGYSVSDIEFVDSWLLFAQYSNMGHGLYNWLIADTLGVIQHIKENPYPQFDGRFGEKGGLFKYSNYVGYWDNLNDTIYKISPDLNYDIICVNTPGEHRLPKYSAAYNPVETFKKNLHKYCISYMFLETNNFFVYIFYLQGHHLALIDKISGLTKSIDLGNNKKGFINNIDNGIEFLPENYFTDIEQEYLVSTIHPFAIKALVVSEAFKTSTPKYPEKKRELEELANSLTDNDNPVLMLIKLKE